MPKPTGKGNEWWRWMLLFIYLVISSFGAAAFHYWVGPGFGQQFSSYWNALAYTVFFFVFAMVSYPFLKFLDRLCKKPDESIENRKKKLEADRQNIIAEARARQGRKESDNLRRLGSG